MFGIYFMDIRIPSQWNWSCVPFSWMTLPKLNTALLSSLCKEDAALTPHRYRVDLLFVLLPGYPPSSLGLLTVFPSSPLATTPSWPWLEVRDFSLN
ncbi:hypothetical protein HN51_043762 [Arachis hypogaea]